MIVERRRQRGNQERSTEQTHNNLRVGFFSTLLLLYDAQATH